MGHDETTSGNSEEYAKKLQNSFRPVAGINARFKVLFADNPRLKPVVIDVANSRCECSAGESGECDVIITTDQRVFVDILDGRITFQRAFMDGSIKMKGDFKLLRSMDQPYGCG